MPSNKESLLHCAVSWFRLLLLRAEAEKWTDDFGIFFDAKDPDVQRTGKYLLECIESSPKDAAILGLYAQFLDKTRDFSGTEGMFLCS